ncbi:MAG: uncharacterized protein KVP18_000627 [Porospora cf. gigantea A]|uniref:uncharacterized protein n=1 Tax=Porospora cf. gigantea A TaxID=2853593 RepID=UPI00355A278C|nr:MAG: hypothetical protein KVP18_000627 [Porospora cf. gigantea A]
MSEELEAAFKRYCTGASQTPLMTMSSKVLTKMLKDNKIYTKKFTTTDSDLEFSKVAKKQKVIDFTTFQQLVANLATRKGVEIEAFTSSLLSSEGPLYTATIPDNVRLHDDKSGYTGVHKQGGPSTVDRNPTQKYDSVSDITEPYPPLEPAPLIWRICSIDPPLMFVVGRKPDSGLMGV